MTGFMTIQALLGFGLSCHENRTHVMSQKRHGVSWIGIKKLVKPTLLTLHEVARCRENVLTRPQIKPYKKSAQDAFRTLLTSFLQSASMSRAHVRAIIYNGQALLTSHANYYRGYPLTRLLNTKHYRTRSLLNSCNRGCKNYSDITKSLKASAFIALPNKYTPFIPACKSRPSINFIWRLKASVDLGNFFSISQIRRGGYPFFPRVATKGVIGPRLGALVPIFLKKLHIRNSING